MPLESILKKITRVKLLVIGDLILDHYVFGTADRISPEAPVPIVKVLKENYVLGGAANVCQNIVQLGGKTSIIGVLGTDIKGELFKNMLDQKGIGRHLVVNKPNTITTVKTRVIAQHQQLCRIDHEDKPSKYTIDKDKIITLVEKEIKNYEGILLSDYAKGVLSDELVKEIISLAKKYHKMIAVDPKPNREINFQEVDLLTPNRNESYTLARIDPLLYENYPAEAICKAIWKRYKPKNLIITLGADGMLISQKGVVIKKIPTYAQEVFDVSGAGDTVIASLTLALAAQIDIEKAAHFANIAAGIVVGKIGTATTTPQEIIQYSLKINDT